MNMIAEMFGYLASLMLAISLMVTKEMRFRIINSAGCLFFIIYGLLIKAWPIVLTNSLLLAINCYYIYRISRRREDFDVVDIKPNDDMLKKFLQYYQQDFKNYYPHFDPQNPMGNIAFMVMRDMQIASVFVAQKDANGAAEVIVNYTIPKFRDFKIGKYLFQNNTQQLKNRGVNRLYYSSVHNPSHIDFLMRSGFEKQADGKGYSLGLK